MVMELVHSAVARKMLCSPANSLIADTEFFCAAGILLKKMGWEDTKADFLMQSESTAVLQKRLLELIDSGSREEAQGRETVMQNLIEMIERYRPDAASVTEQLKEVFLYACQKELVFPKGNF